MTIITRSCRVPTDRERRDDWRRRIGTYRSKRGPVPDCPQADEFDERTPAPHTAEPVREAGKES